MSQYRDTFGCLDSKQDFQGRFQGLPPLRFGDPRKGEAESKKNTAAV